MTDPNSWATAAVGLGVLIASLYNGWQSVQAKREAKHARAEATGARTEATMAKGHASAAADNSKPVSNGFSEHVRSQLAAILVTAGEARDAATRAEDKVDRHLEAHANAALTPLRSVAP